MTVVQKSNRPAKVGKSKTKKRGLGNLPPKVWITLSFLLTALILGWAFSMPLRSGGLSYAASQDDPPQPPANSASGGQAQQHWISDADEFRAAAIALDEEFLRARRLRTKTAPVPGKTEVKQRWDKHVDLVNRQLKQIGSPQKGSVTWQEKQDLIESLKDKPE